MKITKRNYPSWLEDGTSLKSLQQKQQYNERWKRKNKERQLKSSVARWRNRATSLAFKMQVNIAADVFKNLEKDLKKFGWEIERVSRVGTATFSRDAAGTKLKFWIDMKGVFSSVTISMWLSPDEMIIIGIATKRLTDAYKNTVLEVTK